MNRRFFGIVIFAAIFLMVVPPLFNTIDTWDKRPEFPAAGHDTETSISMLSIEIGMCLTVAWASVLLLNWLASMFVPRTEGVRTPRQPGVRATEYLLLLFSPPWAFTTLRI